MTYDLHVSSLIAMIRSRRTVEDAEGKGKAALRSQFLQLHVHGQDETAEAHTKLSWKGIRIVGKEKPFFHCNANALNEFAISESEVGC